MAMQRHRHTINALAKAIAACVLNTKARPDKEARAVLACVHLGALNVCAGEEALKAELKEALANRHAVHSLLNHAPAQSANTVANAAATAADHISGKF